MLRNLLIFSSLLLSATTFAQQTEHAKRINNTLTPQLTPAQQLIAGTGEDSLNSYGIGHARTVISGYGEAHYQKDVDMQRATANLTRAVLFVGHQFNGRIAFFSELEVENAKVEGGGFSGEVAMEQAYLKFSLNPRQYILAGLMLPRIGIINENHLPINFNGVERPMVETLLIPAVWRELGVAFYGQMTTIPLTYSIMAMNGLNNADFEHGTGIGGGRAEGQLAGANNMAVNAAVQYFAGNWKFQVSGYAGGSTTLGKRGADSLQLESGLFGSTVYLGEADIQYSNHGITFKALGCGASIPEAYAINRAYDNNTPLSMYGGYAELGYNLLSHSKSPRCSNKQLNIFARYETLDLNASIPSNGLTDGTLKQSHIIAGLGYFPIPQVAIKADVRLMQTGDQNSALLINPNPNALPYNNHNTFINVGIGYSF
jgi:hypothetical protein